MNAAWSSQNNGRHTGGWTNPSCYYDIAHRNSFLSAGLVLDFRVLPVHIILLTPNTMRTWTRCGVFLAAFAAATAGAVMDSRVPANGSAAVAPPTPLMLRWSPCPLKTPMGPALVECANASAPLNYSAPNSSKTIQLHVRRLRSASSTPPAGDVFVLCGGPGMAQNPETYQALFYLLGGTHDVYFADYRGTGQSASLGSYGCLGTDARVQ